MKKKQIIIILITALIIGGGVTGFLIYKHNSTNSTASRANLASNGFGGGNFAGRPGSAGAAGMNFGAVTGTIDTVSGDTIVINDTNDSGQTIMIVSGSTTITKTVATTMTDIIQVGQNITVEGTKSGNTVAATTVTLTANMATNTSRPSGAARPSGGYTRSGSNSGSPRPSGTGEQFGGGNNTIGKITSVSGNTITIQSFNNTTYTINVDSNTQYMKMTTGSITDLTAKTKVTGIGQKDSSGAIEARSISIQS